MYYIIGFIGFVAIGCLLFKGMIIASIFSFVMAFCVVALKIKEGKGPKYINIYQLVEYKKIVGEKRHLFKPTEEIEATSDNEAFAYVYYFVSNKGRTISAVAPVGLVIGPAPKGTEMIVWDSIFKPRCITKDLLLKEKEDESLIELKTGVQSPFSTK